MPASYPFRRSGGLDGKGAAANATRKSPEHGRYRAPCGNREPPRQLEPRARHIDDKGPSKIAQLRRCRRKNITEIHFDTTPSIPHNVQSIRQGFQTGVSDPTIDSQPLAQSRHPKQQGTSYDDEHADGSSHGGHYTRSNSGFVSTGKAALPPRRRLSHVMIAHSTIQPRSNIHHGRRTAPP